MADSHFTTSVDLEAERKAKKAAYMKAWREANKEHVAAYEKVYNAGRCKEENAARVRAWCQANPEKVVAKRKAYYQANKEEDAARCKAYREANRGSLTAKQKVYREANKEEIAARKRAYREANMEKEAARVNAWREANQERIDASNKAYRETNKEEIATRDKAWRRANRGRKYGLTADQYAEMLAACNGRCPCCKSPFSEITKTTPCVDHCHGTGKVRGIICRRCNLLIGHAEDQSSVLRTCAQYLDKANNRETP